MNAAYEGNLENLKDCIIIGADVNYSDVSDLEVVTHTNKSFNG